MQATSKLYAWVTDFLQRHHVLLWHVHSIYALLFGVGVMWLGSQDFTYVRIAIFHVAFIWLSSFFLPWVDRLPLISPPWHRRIHLVVNYFNRNFYQQLLFFVLPIYFASATFWSGNLLFVLVIAVSAVLSTMDLFYDRHLAANRPRRALFFAFNLFACINVMLPILWSVSNTRTVRISGALAFLGFATLFFKPAELRTFRTWMTIGGIGLLLLGLAEKGRVLIPPAPLQLVSYSFGESLDRDSKEVSPSLSSLAPGWSGRVYALTAIRAPLGLQEKVGHVWSLDGSEIYASPFYLLTGGRAEGFRIFTGAKLRPVATGETLRVDVLTEGGQIIGRARLLVRKP